MSPFFLLSMKIQRIFRLFTKHDNIIYPNIVLTLATDEPFIEVDSVRLMKNKRFSPNILCIIFEGQKNAKRYQSVLQTMEYVEYFQYSFSKRID